jgi:hypothetical protein
MSVFAKACLWSCWLVAVGCATAEVEGEGAGEDEDIESALAASDCPTAPKRAVTWWRWATVEDLETLAWSPSGSEILVSEHLYEKKSALIGYDDTRKDCHRLAVYAPNGTRLRELMPLTPGFVPYFPGSLTYMPAYAVSHVQNYALDPVGLWEAIRIAPNGSRRSLFVWPKCHYGQVIPSPDGTKMALLDIVMTCGGAAAGSTTVKFLDAAGNPTGSTATVTFPNWPVGTWTPAGAFIITDRSTAKRVDLDGTTTTVAVPQCTEPATASSEVAHDGRIASIVNGKPGVIGTDASRAFGCQ